MRRIKTQLLHLVGLISLLCHPNIRLYNTYSAEGLLTLIHILDQCLPTASTWRANIFTLHVSRNTNTRFSSLNRRKRTRSESIRMHSELNRSNQRIFAVFRRMPALIGSHSGIFRNCNELLHTPVVKQHSTRLSTAFQTWRCHRRHTPNPLLQIKWGLSHNHIIASFRTWLVHACC